MPTATIQPVARVVYPANGKEFPTQEEAIKALRLEQFANYVQENITQNLALTTAQQKALESFLRKSETMSLFHNAIDFAEGMQIEVRAPVEV